MTPEVFVEGIRKVALDGAVRGVMSGLTDMADCIHANDGSKVAIWYESLTVVDKLHVERVANEAARQAIYNLLMVLDGWLFIEDGEEKGEFVLIYRRGMQTTVIGEPLVSDLSGLFKATREHDKE
jgi:hypothetical protein